MVPGGVGYTPAPDYHGPDAFSYTAADPGGLTATALVAVEVLPVNEPPEAEDDAAETQEDEPVVVDVLANDRDPDGDRLRVVDVTTPAHGSATVAPGGVRYAPARDCSGACCHGLLGPTAVPAGRHRRGTGPQRPARVTRQPHNPHQGRRNLLRDRELRQRDSHATGGSVSGSNEVNPAPRSGSGPRPVSVRRLVDLLAVSPDTTRRWRHFGALLWNSAVRS